MPHKVPFCDRIARRDLLQIVHHGAERADVSVNVGDHRDAHYAACSLA